MGLPPFPVERARSTISGLANACKGLQDFGTLQIVHLSLTTLPTWCWCGRHQCGKLGPYSEERKQELREEKKVVKDLAIDRLKRPETGRGSGGERKETTLRVIELNSTFNHFPWRDTRWILGFRLGSVEAEEYKA